MEIDFNFANAVYITVMLVLMMLPLNKWNFDTLVQIEKMEHQCTRSSERRKYYTRCFWSMLLMQVMCFFAGAYMFVVLISNLNI